MSMEVKGFFDKVYDIVADIPEGEILTYGQIAAMVGSPRASRIVGYAMNSAPLGRKLPCHRVVSKTGQLAPDDVFGGKEKQREMLEREGINFLENGCIDMKSYENNSHAFPR
jgi:methylated-DNA-protein-cysteine methyltransferase-like protein